MTKGLLKKAILVVPEKESGFRLRVGHSVQVIKRSHYWVTDIPVTGDAPKDFIKVYEYGTCRKASRKNWVGYISKVGHKLYPNESITEYLLNRFGEILGFHMAKSRLVWLNGQLRFLSRYFLKRNEVLYHGADIFSGYLSNDKEFVKEIEAKKLSREFFSLQFIKHAIDFGFPNEGKSIMHDFVKMLLFDAFVGNADRHFFNWGAVKDFSGGPSRFSPIYDTARGLFWNELESHVIDLYNSRNKSVYLKYIKKSRPKVGWEGESNINHLQLVKLISTHQFSIQKSEILELFSEKNLNLCLQVIESEFSDLMSKERRTVIGLLLRYRLEQLSAII